MHLRPDYFPYLAFLGLIYPILLVTGTASLLYFAFRKQKEALIFAIVIVSGFNHILDFFSFGNSNPPPNASLKVMSYNVRMFNRYMWIDDKNIGSKIIELIRKQSPDILCLQEFYSQEDKANYQDSIIKTQLTDSYLISYKHHKKYGGNAIFSRYPIVNEGFINIGISNHKCIFADIQYHEDTIRVYSLHLASMHLNYGDYEFIDGKKSEKKRDKLSKMFHLWLKLAKAYERRSVEVQIISPHINKSPYPTIICGDFNDPPMSYTYKILTRRYKDAFLKSGFGIGRTFSKFAPTFRIDYILHSKDFLPFEFTRLNAELSDHYAITCKFLKK